MLQAKIQEDLKQAQLSRDTLKTSVLRMLLSELTYAKVAKGIKTEDVLPSEEIIVVVQKESKKRKEAIESFKNAGRVTAVEKEEAELTILNGYLPTQLSDEELTKIVEDNIKEVGASSKSDMGRVIGAVKNKVGQQAEGSRISAIVQQKLI